MDVQLGKDKKIIYLNEDKELLRDGKRMWGTRKRNSGISTIG